MRARLFLGFVMWIVALASSGAHAVPSGNHVANGTGAVGSWSLNLAAVSQASQTGVATFTGGSTFIVPLSCVVVTWDSSTQTHLLHASGYDKQFGHFFGFKVKADLSGSTVSAGYITGPNGGPCNAGLAQLQPLSSGAFLILP